MEDTIKKLFEVDPKEVPSSIPLFPLENVLLLPFGKLPLNIFEERYINMVLDSLKSHRMIGIIQPRNNNNDFFMMGCIGKITSYIETPDYRLVLNLEGVCRFALHERNLTPKGYYQAIIDTTSYLDDLKSLEPMIDRDGLTKKYADFFKMKKLQIDREVLGETSNLQLLSTLAMLAPFNKIDKQAILESPNLKESVNNLNSIIDLNKFNGKILSVVFKEYRKDELKFISFNAKKARGLMTQFIIKNKIDSNKDIKEFDYDNYNFDSKLSDDSTFVFTR